MKLIRDILTEHGEYSLKRIIALTFAILTTVHATIMLTNGPIQEGHELLFGEMLSFVTVLLGLSVANKHKALRKTTNTDGV